MISMLLSHYKDIHKDSLKHKSCFCQELLCDYYFACGYCVPLKILSCSAILFFLVDFSRTLYPSGVFLVRKRLYSILIFPSPVYCALKMQQKLKIKPSSCSSLPSWWQFHPLLRFHLPPPLLLLHPRHPHHHRHLLRRFLLLLH